MSIPTPPLTALVFGASGITGHAILKSLLTYPTPTTFARIIGLTNRPLTTADSHLDADQRVELYSGIDLLDREKSLLQLQHVPGIQQVTHVYYASYAGHGQDFDELKRVNSELLTNAIGGVEICCPGLRFITLNTGGKVSVRFPHRKMLSVGKWIATGYCQRRSSLSQSTCPSEAIATTAS
jgi:hypothetical protein